MAINLDALLIRVVLNVIIIAPMLWLAGRTLSGKDKAKFTDALWIAVLGTVIGYLIHFAFSGIAATIVVLILWLGLIKHFFDCGWLKAFLIALVAAVIFVIISVVLAAMGLFALRPFLQFP